MAVQDDVRELTTRRGSLAVRRTGNSHLTLDSANIMVWPLPAGQPRLLIRGVFFGRYVPSGHLIYLPKVWSPTTFGPVTPTRLYDLHPDGRRVAIAKPPDQSGETRDKVVFIVNRRTPQNLAEPWRTLT